MSRGTKKKCRGTMQNGEFEYNGSHEMNYFAVSVRAKVTIFHQGSMKLNGLNVHILNARIWDDCISHYAWEKAQLKQLKGMSLSSSRNDAIHGDIHAILPYMPSIHPSNTILLPLVAYAWCVHWPRKQLLQVKSTYLPSPPLMSSLTTPIRLWMFVFKPGGCQISKI